MGTTAAKLLLAVGAFVGVGSCVPAGPSAGPPTPAPTPAPVSESIPGRQEPDIRVGLLTKAATVTVGGGAQLVVSEPDGSWIAHVPAGATWRVVPSGGGLAVGAGSGPLSRPYDALTIAPALSDGQVQVDGRGYRGVAEILRDGTGVTVINRLPMEQYLQGVVSAEMGRRRPEDQEALRAQAIVSRTYAMRNMGRWRAQGFDLQATVADQVYGGVGAETAEGADAVTTTRGLAVTFGGAPIDAFFYSTCGGKTADGVEVFRQADRPYLRSVSDVGADGLSYCAISPRYRWREEWTGAAILATLRRTLPAVLGVAHDQIRELRDVRVVTRTGSGRVDQLAVGLGGGTEIQIPGRQIRQVLRTGSGDILRSNAFALMVSGAGHAVRHLVVDGQGAGHGVGLCQWGAVGRARAGQRYDQILAAYYRGTTVERLY